MTTTPTIEVRDAAPADYADVAAALSGAFYADPVFRWVYPDDDVRRAVLPPAFTLLAGAIGRHGTSLTTGDGIGAALWVPPGETVVDEADAPAFDAALTALSPADAERLGTCFELMGEQHPHEPHWYLNLIGVVPEAQGRGIGSALFRPALERCDRAGEPAYLEATSAENRRLYERHGFVVVGEIRLPDGPSLYPMWRDPVT